MKSISFDVPDEYPWVILGCLILCFECAMTAILGSKQRQKCFTEDYMKKFNDEHIAAFGTASTPSKGGYPTLVMDTTPTSSAISNGMTSITHSEPIKIS